MIYYDPCAFWTTALDGTSEGKTVRINGYSLEQFKRCLKCKHFETYCEDYKCKRPGGKACLLETIDLFEPK